MVRLLLTLARCRLSSSPVSQVGLDSPPPGAAAVRGARVLCAGRDVEKVNAVAEEIDGPMCMVVTEV
jgi:hypothetical protein